MGMLAGCSSQGDPSGSSSETSSQAEKTVEDTAAAVAGTVSAEESTPEDTTLPTDEPEVIRVSALKGPTAMGMIKMMDDESENDSYQFTISGAADEITPAVIQGNTDIACVPANLASVLYNKTGGGVRVLAINTLGVLYICENGEPTIASAADLRGKTIYASGKGATPEYALRYILTQNGIDPDNDVTIEWKSEHSECLSALLSDEGSAAMLPQPFVTTAADQE